MKLVLWNVHCHGQGGKLHSIFCDAKAKRLNVVVLTKTRYFGQTCLELVGWESHTLYNSGLSITSGLMAVWDSLCVVRLVDHSAWVGTLVLGYKGARFDMCVAHAPWSLHCLINSMRHSIRSS